MNEQKPKNILAIASGKGGVGKSTVTTNLAVALKEQGANVGVLDADIYGPSQPAMLGEAGGNLQVNEREELIPCKRHGIQFVSMGLLLGEDSPVIWRAPMAVKVIRQFLSGVCWGPLDYLLIDLPPGTGDVQLTLAQQASLSAAIIVSTPQQIALNIARKGLKMFEQVNVPILGIIENMSGFECEHCNQETRLFPGGGAKVMAENSGVPFLGKIPLDPQILICSDSGVPVLVDQPDSNASKAYKLVGQRLVAELETLKQRSLVPEPKEVEVQPEGSLRLLWPDSHEGTHHAYTLRTQCACASCISEDTGKPLLDPHSVPLNIQVRKAVRVGRYALNLEFSDGHSSGLYSYDRLRSLCECSACREKLSQAASFEV
jgi:ATP-binding protein involved in chromosome partitioning